MISIKPVIVIPKPYTTIEADMLGHRKKIPGSLHHHRRRHPLRCRPPSGCLCLCRCRRRRCLSVLLELLRQFSLLRVFSVVCVRWGGRLSACRGVWFTIKAQGFRVRGIGVGFSDA